MKNKILYGLLGVIVVLNVGLIVFLSSNRDCDCECNVPELSEEDIVKNKYMELNNKMVEYLNEIYNPSEYVIEDNESSIHKITLREIKEKGYDTSMFINPKTMKECNLDNSYGRFVILGTREDGTLDYTFNINLECEDIYNGE